MAGQLSNILNLIRNMGWRYTAYRARYEVLRRSGLLKRKFPGSPAYQQYLTLEGWKASPAKFFFKNKESLTIPREPQPILKENFNNIQEGKLLLFNSVLSDLGKNYDWVTNPDTAFRYDINKHWTEIADYSKEAGDIKYVWEKSRFSYLYDIIRYDYHFNEDCSAVVFSEIISWIDTNPINCGPNYRCSQEMSLRVLNWTFALHYYRNSPVFTDEVFNKMQHVIYWHLHHIYNNINFSRIAVRNNHAITETLTLYLAGIFYPTMPGAAQWKKQGKQWFEEEIAYQVYEDGTFLQFSMNYHRVVVQLLTLGIALSELNGDTFRDVVYDRARKSLFFLRTCMIDENGWLPNYGANDGALFFKLSNAHFRDYRPQLQALANVLRIDLGFADKYEDALWYGSPKATGKWLPPNGTHKFVKGGYYIMREVATLTFIKCGSYKDRPSQADNLHLDVWYKGENILLDAGSYKYNTDEATMRYFSGTAAHNTVMLDDNDQMLKGGRFIWYYWSQCKSAVLDEDYMAYTFTGAIHAFTYIKKGIVHRRTVIKKKGIPAWEVRDIVTGVPKEFKMKQLWHVPIGAIDWVLMIAKNDDGKIIDPQVSSGWSSSLYGQKGSTEERSYSAGNNIVETIIKVVNP